ncbi:KH domain-containing protein [Microbotryomycetes sp. JL201]|nr:KH domain-containing protein [Microbotryomycetes sp. JL201]
MDIYSTSFILPRNAAAFDLAPRIGSDDAQRRQHSSTTSSVSGALRRSSSPLNGQAAEAGIELASSTAAYTQENASTAATTPSAHSEDRTLTADPRSRSASGSATAEGPKARPSLDLNDQMQRVCVDAMAKYQCLVSFSPASNQTSESSVAVASRDPPRADTQSLRLDANLAHKLNIHRKLVVKVPRAEVLDGRGNVKAEMRRRLDEVASTTRAHLAIVGQAHASMGFGLETERHVEIVITGSYGPVEHARVRLLVMLDELSGLHFEACEIDYKLHNIISGRKRCVIQTIQEETGTNIYFPTPFSGALAGPHSASGGWENLVFITGEFFGVQRARDMLYQVSMHKSKCIISRDTAMLPRKLDWMLQDRLDELRQIMNDNGTFVNFPSIGSQASLISVYGDHRVHIERTIRAIMQIACQFYVASFWLLPISFDVFMPPPTVNSAQIPSILHHIANSSGAEAVFKSNCFEFHGLEHEVRLAVQLVLELDFVKQFHNEIRFQIELANEHREFISGKKNGKLNKVMKLANVKVKFETFNDFNFLIEVAGNGASALRGLTLLQEELPAEISFHVPEAYHKRIIGVGGRNIQRIMKNYGVYVKFSNAEEFATLGGYAENEDNVIARTPSKNAINLDHLKQSIMELVAPRDKDYVVETVSVPRRYHRTLLGDKSIFIHDIEAKTNSIVRFPNKELASDMVSIFGPESQVHIAAQMLLDHVPFEAELRLPHSEEMAALTLSPEWVALTERVKHDLSITILPWVDRSGSEDETIVRFCLNRSNVDFLAPARDLVEEFLVQQGIKMFPGTLRPRSDSFANAFPFFNSKLLSRGLGKNTDQQEGNEERTKLRMAASTPDIKAIFDEGQQAFHSRYRNAATGQADQRPAQAIHPGIPHSHRLPVYGGALAGTQVAQWGFMPSAGSEFRLGTGSSHALSRATVPVSGRHSLDSKLPPGTTLDSSVQEEPASVAASPRPDQPPSSSEHESVEQQLRQIPARQPRSLAGRAQSLDLSAHATPRRFRGHQAHESIDHVSRTFSNLDMN